MNIRGSTLLLILLFPILDLYLLIKVGGMIGASWAVFLVVFTSVLGFLVLKNHGVNTLTGVQAQIQRGEMPARSLAEGAMVMFGGFLLLMPGFMSDFLGLLTLFPPFRAMLWRRIQKKAGVHMHVQQAYYEEGRVYEGEATREPDAEQRTLEGEYKREKDS